MSIPKTIHYCWFGGKPLPPFANKCISSWQKFLPDYEIKRWDESNFNVNIIPYTQQAYGAKKFAFVSDYARFWILYNYGGIYFDTDVELIKGIDDIVTNGAFMGCEHQVKPNTPPSELGIAPGLGVGIEAKHPIMKKLLDIYQNKIFIDQNGKCDPETIVTITTNVFCELGLKSITQIQEVDNIFIYPSDYFCPLSTEDGKLRISENTRSIHWYDQSWQSPLRKYGRKIILALGGTKLKTIIKRIVFSKS